MKIITQKKMLVLVILLLCSLSINLVFAIANNEPGSEQDPIVSKSYVDSCIINLQNEIKKLTDEVETLKNRKPSGESGFEVISIEKGQVIYTGSGTEIILRSGKAVAIKGTGGGLSDTTSAKDLLDGVALSTNHLLISSRDDGRGVKANSKCYFLVRGTYSQKGNSNVTEEPEQQKSNLTGVVKASILNVRAQPEATAQILTKLKSGDTIKILETKNNWHKIQTAGNITGWVVADYID